MKKKIIQISATVAIFCLSTMFAIWASAESSAALNLDITATGVSFGRGKGNCLQASSGIIEANFPTIPYTYTYDYTKNIGKVTSMVQYSADNLEPLTLEEEIMVHIHVDGSFRTLDEGEWADIILLEIRGCTSVDAEGVQYCISAYEGIPSSDVGNIGKVTKMDNTWWVTASIPAATEQGGAPSLCVNRWEQGNIVDGFCIPLYGLEIVCTGTITK